MRENGGNVFLFQKKDDELDGDICCLEKVGRDEGFEVVKGGEDGDIIA